MINKWAAMWLGWVLIVGAAGAVVYTEEYCVKHQSEEVSQLRADLARDKVVIDGGTESLREASVLIAAQDEQIANYRAASSIYTVIYEPSPRPSLPLNYHGFHLATLQLAGQGPLAPRMVLPYKLTPTAVGNPNGLQFAYFDSRSGAMSPTWPVQ
jgi:hypothetical protein